MTTITKCENPIHINKTKTPLAVAGLVYRYDDDITYVCKICLDINLDFADVSFEEPVHIHWLFFPGGP